MIVHDGANRVLKLQIGSEQCALRIPRLNDKDLHVDRRSEQAAIQTASAEGLAPDVLAFEAQSGVMVTRWIDAPVWTQTQAQDPQHIELMASVLRRLHRLAPPSGVRTLDVAALVRGYWATLMAQGENPSRDFLSSHHKMLDLLNERPVENARLCHNDLHSGNIIGDGSALRLLDWEYAGLSDPLFDLASYAQSNDLNAGQKKTLLKAYGATPSIQTRFADECRLFDWICILWLMVSGQHRTTAGGTRLNQLLGRM